VSYQGLTDLADKIDSCVIFCYWWVVKQISKNKGKIITITFLLLSKLAKIRKKIKILSDETARLIS